MMSAKTSHIKGKATATLLLMPNKGRNRAHAYWKVLQQNPGYCTHIADFPSKSLTHMVTSWLPMTTGTAKLTCDMALVAVWSGAGKPTQDKLQELRTQLRKELGAKAPQNTADELPGAPDPDPASTQACSKAFKSQPADEDHSMDTATTPPLPATIGELCTSGTRLLHDWKQIVYTDGSQLKPRASKRSRQAPPTATTTGAGVYHPASNTTKCVDTQGQGVNHTINHAELAAIAIALQEVCPPGPVVIATDSASALSQIRHTLLQPESMVRHKFKKELQAIANIVKTRGGQVTFLKVQAHTGIVGNEVADSMAKYAANLKEGHETGMRPLADPFEDHVWLHTSGPTPVLPQP
jgi:ribonuclease HI